MQEHFELWINRGGSCNLAEMVVCNHYSSSSLIFYSKNKKQKNEKQCIIVQISRHHLKARVRDRQS